MPSGNKPCERGKRGMVWCTVYSGWVGMLMVVITAFLSDQNNCAPDWMPLIEMAYALH